MIAGHQERLAMEASRWVVCLDDAHPDPTDRATERNEAFLDWLEQSPAHLLAFLESFEAYRRLGVIDPDRRIDVDSLLKNRSSDARLHRSRDRASGPPVQAQRPRPGLRAIAASTVVALLVLVATWPLWGPRSPDPAPTSYATRVGERRTITLEDGSTLTLNTATRVEARFAHDMRQIRLTAGEVLLDVRHDSRRPMQLISGDVSIVDAGTKFDVYRSTRAVRVTVIDGAVRLYVSSNPNHALALSAGMMADVIPSASKITAAPMAADALHNSMSWTDGKLYFSRTPLSVAIDGFNRYNTRQLVIASHEIAEYPVSGVFPTTGVDAFVDALSKQGIVPLPPDPPHSNENVIRLGYSSAPKHNAQQ